MTVLAIDGFDHYESTDAPKKGWSANFSAAMAPGRYGFGQSANWTPFSETADNRYPLQATSNATPIVAFAFQFATFGAETPVMSFTDGATPQITLAWNGTTQKFVVRAGGLAGTILGQSAALTTLGAVAWQSVEWKALIHPSAGTVIVRVNGASVLSLTGVVTRATANAYATHVALPAANGAGGNVALKFDDLYVLDTSGSVSNDFLGDARIRTVYPDGDGAHSQMTPSTPGTHFDKVNRSVPDLTSFVSDNVVGDIDSFTYANVPSTTVVKGVQVSSAIVKDDAASRSVAPVSRIGTTDYVGTAVPVTASLQIAKQILATNPATSAAWATTELNSAEFGVKITA